MGRMYSANFTAVAVTAAQDLFELSPADDKPICIHAVYLGQTTELGDSAEEQLRIHIIRGYTASGSGGSTFAPVKLNPNDASSGITNVEINNTTVANTGTAVILHADTYNIRSGWQYLPTPETRPYCSQAETTIVVRLVDAPADSITMTGTILFEELT